ncbi:MAG TPA: hypothetical protein VLA95_08825 [Gemmatimonadales bacterium]|nr:hypothetical protein [Gemmatimonadales bacterium]
MTGADAALAVGRVVVIGGGCYGTFYAGQLARATEKGALRPREVVVVDRDPACRAARELPAVPGRRLVADDWDRFLDRWLGGGWEEPAAPDDLIVPSPLMPHLLHGWLLRRAEGRWPGRAVTTRGLEGEVGTPYDTLAPDGTRYVSFADWLCPTHCIEPATCPVIRAPRTWEMTEVLARHAERLGAAGPALCVTRHLSFGVGVFGVDEVLAADRLVAEAGGRPAPAVVLVGTVSACHGAVNLLALGPAA